VGFTWKTCGEENNKEGSKHDLDTPFETLRTHSEDFQIHLFLHFSSDLF
jgi:hypothetical protein